MNNTPEFEGAQSIIRKIAQHGYDAFMVGGCVRDFIMGNEPKDIDIATNMPIDELEQLFTTHDIGQSKDFGILCVVIEDPRRTYEVAQFRTESGSSDNRHPDEVVIVNDFKSDCSRRDFTINALGMTSSSTNNIIDYVQGQKDIEDKLIRCVGDPWDRFQEDALRILRMLRFSVRFKFEIEMETWVAAYDHADLLENLSKERITEEMYKVASYGGPALREWLTLSQELGILHHIHPFIDELSKPEFLHNQEHHPEGPDVWHHVLAALETSESKDPIVNLAILFHDIGKPAAYEQVPNDKLHGGIQHQYQNHANIGIAMVEQLCQDMKISNSDKEIFKYCTGSHMIMINALKVKKSKLLKYVRNPHWPILNAVIKADDNSRGEAQRTDHIQKIEERIERVLASIPSEEEQRVRKMVNGHLIIDIHGKIEGRLIGLVKKQVTDWAIDERDCDVSLEEIIDEIRKINIRELNSN